MSSLSKQMKVRRAQAKARRKDRFKAGKAKRTSSSVVNSEFDWFLTKKKRMLITGRQGSN